MRVKLALSEDPKAQEPRCPPRQKFPRQTFSLIQTLMHEFYKKALLACFGLLAASVILGYTCLRLSYLHLPLLPAVGSSMALQIQPSWEVPAGGPVMLQIPEDKGRLRFDFRLAKSAEPHLVAVDLLFRDRKGKPIHLDFSRYASVSFLVKCSSPNTLMLTISTFEQRVSRPEDYLRYRRPEGYFACNESESRVELDLRRLETPQWWFLLSKLNMSRQDYKLNKVPKIAFGSTMQSPPDMISKVEISELGLDGRDRRYLLLFGAILCIAWGGFGLWFFRSHTLALIEDVRGKLQKDLPFVAYQQLSLQPHRDKERTAILQYIASNYANADLDLDMVIAQTGVNRTKIFDVLKSELGFTFSGYLNKLRLTEAARLLAEKDTAAVAEIAYLVGYGNISYFNKLFKEEYGCTPKAFRSACKPTP